LSKQKGVKNNKNNSTPKPKKYCPKCERERPINKFYKSTNSVFPDGICSICSDCFAKDIRVENLESVKDGLMQLNLPFLAERWFSTYENKGDGAFRDYVRQVNSLPQYSGLTWKDSIFENGTFDIYLNNNKQEDNKTTFNAEWRGNYSKSDLDYLESYYKELNNDFKIITMNHKDYARKIAKASLAMDRAYEDMLNGVNGSDKRYKDLKDTFDSLSKSAQFSENTRGINDVSLGCFGVIFDKVEKRIFIPEHQPMDKDIYDKLLDQFSNINKSL
jgi:hypothetical protein